MRFDDLSVSFLFLLLFVGEGALQVELKCCTRSLVGVWRYGCAAPARLPTSSPAFTTHRQLSGIDLLTMQV